MKVESYKVSGTICKECKKQEQVDWKAFQSLRMTARTGTEEVVESA